MADPSAKQGRLPHEPRQGLRRSTPAASSASCIFLGILEQLGVPNRIIGYLFIFLTIGVYALIG